MIVESLLEWVETASVSKRVDAAGALVRAFLSGKVPEEELQDIEAALTTLIEDPAPSVRMEIAICFGAHASAPRHIIAFLADDNLEIATTVLSQSPVFHDAELIDIAGSGEENQQIAIACRPWISNRVSREISKVVCRNAVYALLVNPATEIDPETIHTLATRFGNDTEIRNLLFECDGIASQTRLLLIEQMGGALANFAKDRNWLSETRAKNLVSDACERASILFSARTSDDDVRAIIRNKIAEGKVTASYLLRALCMGNISLMACALSELSGVRHSKVEAVLTQNRSAAFKAIYDRAGMPAVAFRVFQTALASWSTLLASKPEINRSRLPYLVTKEVLSSYSSGQDEVVDKLLVLLRKLAAEAARENARIKAFEISARKKVEKTEKIEEKVDHKEPQAETVEPVDRYNQRLAKLLNPVVEIKSTAAEPEITTVEEPETDPSPLPNIVTKEVLSSYSSGQDEVVDKLLVLLRKLAAEAARENARLKAFEISARKKVEKTEKIEEKVDHKEPQAETVEPVDRYNQRLAKLLNPVVEIKSTAAEPEITTVEEPEVVASDKPGTAREMFEQIMLTGDRAIGTREQETVSNKQRENQQPEPKTVAVDNQTFATPSWQNNVADMNIAEIASKVAKENPVYSEDLDAMYLEMYGLKAEELIDGFSRAA